MAQETFIKLTDDVDGSKASETIQFGFRGVEYEIDLSRRNSAAFEKVVGRYIEAGRRVSSATRRRPATRRTARRTTSARAPRASAANDGIRAWAHSNGFQVGERGRIPSRVREAYEAAIG